MTKTTKLTLFARLVRILSVSLLVVYQSVHGQSLNNTQAAKDTSGVTEKMNHNESTAATDSLSVYTGEYAVSPDFILTFKVTNGELAVIPPGQAPIPMIRLSGNIFADKNSKNVQIEFVRRSDGSVEKVVFNQDGEKMEARRMEPLNSIDPEKLYSVEQLQSDLHTLKTILSENHPRPYEFTSRAAFERSYDSLFATITQPLNEISFRYLLLPLVTQIHCGHTRLDPSMQLQQVKPKHFPPFVLYYENEKAFVRHSANKNLLPGTEIKSINGIMIKQRIENLLARTTGDGTHRSVQYYLMNQTMSWFFYEMPYWYNVDRYQLDVIDAAGQQLSLNLPATDEPTFRQHIPPPPHRQHRLDILDDKNVAVLDYPTLDFPDTTIRNNFLEESFNKLKAARIDRLIVDLRGNGGGSPQNAAYFLKYLIPDNFIYANAAPFPDLVELTKPLTPAENHFNGQIYFLIDGGCFSSTGHLLSLLKYHQIGTFVGEPASASYSCNTNGVPHTLPNTGLIVFCPRHIYETAVNGFHRSEGITPDYEVRQSFDDVLAGRDNALESVLSLLDKN